MKKIVAVLLLLFIYSFLIAQEDQNTSKLSFNGDFRFRIEQDWHSKKSDGTYREDRTRLRYRLRFGISYSYKNWVSFGARIRTGDPKKQQDPQLTLGSGNKEFGGLPIALEKAYAEFYHNWLTAWIGKNTYPFEKQNELFWSDNVFPEGVAIKAKFNIETSLLQSISINAGHFIVITNGTSFRKDSYFQGLQAVGSFLNNKIIFYPSIYYFNKMPDIPDGNETYAINYSILNLGTKAQILDKPKIVTGIDYYFNLSDLEKNSSIPQDFTNQKEGVIASSSLGNLNKKGDWKVLVTYTYLEKYAAVDFLAQNDWTRWDYSSQGSPDGRLTNFKGFEFMAGYMLGEKMNLKLRFFVVNQLVPFGITKESGNRVRLDFNIAL
ncbi:putative porin [Yeosuana sp. MJ-SS3]|uniref:Porin n=1 Tax=Gilvirhabdus luticola TaxID=3079858 RepID=A0ABU3U4X2_9FLAO|nr:putative porin [Yeosuana sp. MJ-SS3]MDU8885411.1 putative porin [Yeosuana sp. MJ-SS3]